MDNDVGNYAKGDVLIEGSKIVEVAPIITAPDAMEIDAAGKIVMPGFIDTPRLRSLAAKRAEAAGTSVDEALTAMGATVPEGRVGTPQEIGEMIAEAAKEIMS